LTVRPVELQNAREFCSSQPLWRCQNDAVTVQEWWNGSVRPWWDAKGRAVEQKNAREAAAARQRAVSGVRSLRDLTDDELIAQAPARTSLSQPHHEMEMQRRLKDSIEALTAETKLARRSATRWSLAIAALTAVILALTVVLALKT
jgi:hypothetical protein